MEPMPLSELDRSLALLQLFTLIAEHGSIAAAARHAHISSSLATRKLAALERSLNARLFERTTRSVKLTEAGAVALEWARQTIKTHADITDDLASIIAQPSGIVRLVVNHYAAVVYLPKLIERFSQHFPDIRLSITTTDSMVNLVEGGYDVAIHSGRIPDSSVIGIRVRAFRRIVCAAPNYLARHGTPQSIQDLARHDCLVHSTNEPLNWFFRSGKTLVSQPVRFHVEVDNHLMLLELVRQGAGVARLGAELVKRDIAKGTLTALLSNYESVYSNGELPGLWILYPNRKVLYRTRSLIDFLVAELSQE